MVYTTWRNLDLPRAKWRRQDHHHQDPHRGLWGIIKKFKGDGATVFLTTHYIEEAEFQAAPISNGAYVMGEVLAGCVILLLGGLFGVMLSYNLLFRLGFLFNSLVFSSLAVGLAMLIKSHADQAMMTSSIITPMAFLGETFFPVEHLPGWAQRFWIVAKRPAISAPAWRQTGLPAAGRPA